nr:MAG TPA: hypothetical protein [Caudoviricetes sp.]
MSSNAKLLFSVTSVLSILLCLVKIKQVFTFRGNLAF